MSASSIRYLDVHVLQYMCAPVQRQTVCYWLH